VTAQVVQVPAQTIALQQQPVQVVLLQAPTQAVAAVQQSAQVQGPCATAAPATVQVQAVQPPVQYVLQAVMPAPTVAQATVAPTAAVTPVTVVTQKNCLARALGAFGTKLAMIGQPTVTQGYQVPAAGPVAPMTVVPTPPVPTVQYVIQQAPAPQAAQPPSPQQALASPQAAPRKGWFGR
jgi:hypothetical protein